MTCWDCFDFEAAIAHEVGHLLGLGHPDLAGHETLAGYSGRGANSYHVDLARGQPFNSTTCLSPWAGVRAGAPGNVSQGGIRPSIMVDFTKHKPKSCLELDDLEALNVLYPDCLGGPSTPLCDKPALNLGWLRMLMFVGIFCIALLYAGTLRAFARYKLRSIATREIALLAGEKRAPTDAEPIPADAGFGAVGPR